MRYNVIAEIVRIATSSYLYSCCSSNVCLPDCARVATVLAHQNIVHLWKNTTNVTQSDFEFSSFSCRESPMKIWFWVLWLLHTEKLLCSVLTAFSRVSLVVADDVIYNACALAEMIVTCINTCRSYLIVDDEIMGIGWQISYIRNSEQILIWSTNCLSILLRYIV